MKLNQKLKNKTPAIILWMLTFNVQAQIQTEWVLYKNAQVGLQGYGSGSWHWPGVAMTSGMSLVYSNRNLTIDTCRWAYAWNPNTGASPTGIRLVSYNNGVVVPLQEVTMPNRSTPTSDGRDITAQIKWIISTKQPVWLATQTVGNGAVGPLIYSSVIECTWNI